MGLENIILSFNPWWDKRPIDAEKLGRYRRDQFDRIYAELAAERPNKVLSIVGPRQSGKTTLVHQIIAELIGKAGIEPKQVLYVSFDPPELRLDAKNSLTPVLEFYERTVLGEPLSKTKQDVYIFFDEAQKVSEWSDQIKYWHETNARLHIVISGSSALSLIQGAGESLIGRVSHHVLLPLSFREFARIKLGLVFAAPSPPENRNFSSIEEAYSELVTKKKELEFLLESYAKYGGYPEVHNMDDPEKGWKILSDLRTLTIKRDILDLTEVKDTKVLDDLLVLLSRSAGHRINYDSLAKTLQVNLESVKRYVGLFEAVFFIRLSYVHSGSAGVSARKMRKAYFVDPGFRNALLSEKRLSQTDLGQLVENVVFAACLRRGFEKELEPRLFFWTDKKGREVDIVIPTPDKGPLPVEVKYTTGDKINCDDLTGLLTFMRETRTKTGLVVTRDVMRKQKLENGCEIYFIPVWLFLLAFA